MSLRLRIAAWFLFSTAVLIGVLLTATHLHLDEELRKDRWDRSHPKFPDWVIHGSYTDEEVGDILKELSHVWLAAGLPVLVLSGLVGYLLARRSVLPIREINHALDALDPTNTAAGVRLKEYDSDLAELVTHLNRLLADVHKAYREISDFSGRVAHELRTPLTHLRMKLEASAPRLPAEFAEEFSEELLHLSRMIDRLLLLARADAARIQPELRAVGLRALLDEFHDTYSLLAQEKQMRILWKLDVAEQWICDPDWLRQILHNLLGNVVRHGSHKARFSARTSQGQLRVRIINYVSPCTSFGAASTAILPGDGNGMGIGLRLVEKLVALLPGSSLKIRRTPRAFSVHLLLRF